MNALQKAYAATDREILAALNHDWQFTCEVTGRVLGSAFKVAVPHFKARMNRLAKAGLVLKEPDKIRGQERWKLP